MSHPSRRATGPGVAAALAATGALALIVAGGCDGAETAPVDDGPRAITIQFAPRVGDRPLDCTTTYQDLGVAGAVARLRDLRLYVHDVRLVDVAGTEVPLELDQDGANQVEGVALLDFEDATGTCERGTETTRQVITGIAPAGSYRGLRFRLGVPQELNHIDVTGAPPPLDLSPLFWGWSDGRIFLSTSLAADNEAGGERVFQIQMASSGCVGDPRVGDVVSCERPNRGAIELDDVDVDADAIVVDLGALLEGVDLRVAPSCHADAEDPACQRILAAAGVAAETGAESPSTQVFFRVDTP